MTNAGSATSAPSEYGKPRCLITDFDEAGRSIYSSALDESIDIAANSIPGMHLYNAYMASKQPVQLTDGADMKNMDSLFRQDRLFPEGCTVLRYVDFLPGGKPVMHRTVTLDFGVIIHGEVELTLDSGEKKLMRPGDTIVQRGTMHQWRNPHPSQTCRALFVLVPIEPVKVNGEVLDEALDVGK